MKDKKGAVELSMTTVIVIILGVVLLTLGLAFVRNIFGKVGDLTTTAFGKADADIEKLGNIEDELTITRRVVDLEQGGSEGIGVVVKNLGNKESSFQLKTSLPGKTAQKAKFTCEVQESQGTQSKVAALPSGEQRAFHILLIDEGNTDLGTYVCEIVLFKDGKESLSDSIRINVK